MNKDDLLNEQVEKILPEQKPLDNRNFFQRNKKLFIIIGLILLILYVGVSIYVRYAFNNISQQLNSLPQ